MSLQLSCKSHSRKQRPKTLRKHHRDELDTGKALFLEETQIKKLTKITTRRITFAEHVRRAIDAYLLTYGRADNA
jgi:hypothetical protein